MPFMPIVATVPIPPTNLPLILGSMNLVQPPLVVDRVTSVSKVLHPQSDRLCELRSVIDLAHVRWHSSGTVEHDASVGVIHGRPSSQHWVAFLLVKVVGAVSTVVVIIVSANVSTLLFIDPALCPC